MLGTRGLGRYRFRLPLIASILYLLFAGLAYGTMYLVESSGGSFVVGIQNLIFLAFYLSSAPWMWALDSLESVHKVHAGTQYLVILRNMSLIEARRTKARAIRLRFS